MQNIQFKMQKVPQNEYRSASRTYNNSQLVYPSSIGTALKKNLSLPLPIFVRAVTLPYVRTYSTDYAPAR
jgi:hypothetical protein